MSGHDFWPSSGYRLLEVRDDGSLLLTDAFLQSLYLRPEVAPIASSCAAELALHESLMASPRREVDSVELQAMQDADAQANWTVLLRFRDRLLQAPSVQAAYLNLFRGEGVSVPPLFVFQLTQILLRHILGNEADPLAARMAECLFRVQQVAILEDGAVMAADAETIERHAEGNSFGSLGELLQRQRVPLRTVDLDVLSRENAELYWPRDEHFDFAVSLNRGQPTLDALMRVLEAWIQHFLGVAVRIEHRRKIEDEHWVWHVGLDAEASGILNDLYLGHEVAEERLARLLGLFELKFLDPADMRAEIAGRPVYLAMAIDHENRLKLKPQNLLLNLPLARH